MNKVLKHYPELVIEQESLKGVLEFGDVFGRGGEVHVEIGSGKGTFILAAAMARPEVNFLGVEWANRYYRYAVDRVGRWGARNVRLLRTDAAVLLDEFIGAETVDCFHIYYPDPWPKKRHHKRRLIDERNFGNILRCLKVGGVIQLATDHENYFEQMVAVTGKFAGVLERIEFERSASAKEGEYVGTNYERKYVQENRGVNVLAFRKLR